MIKLQNILQEDINMFSCEVLIKTTKQANKVEVYNKIRAISGVVIVTIRHSDFLDSKSTETFEWSLLYIKFTVTNKPSQDITNIGVKATSGATKIEGLIQLLPRYSSLKKVAAYTKSGQ